MGGKVWRPHTIWARQNLQLLTSSWSGWRALVQILVDVLPLRHVDLKWSDGTPTKRQVSKRQVSKRPVSKRLKRQVYKTSVLQNVRFTKCQVYKTSGLQNVRLQKNIHIYSVLVVGGNPQVLLQPCLQTKGWLCYNLYFRGVSCHISP
jgi:hypothetical protein